MGQVLDESYLDHLLQVAMEAAREAGALIRENLVTPDFRVRHKGRIDLLTEVDVAAERLILDRLEAVFPTHAVLAEESGRVAGANRDAEFLWIVDPLDGTTNFSHTNPHCAVSIACTRGAEVLAGVVFDPARDELFSARVGGTTELNGRPIRVSTVERLEDSLVATGFAYDRRERADYYIGIFRDMVCAAQGVRRNGAAALDLAWVACGRFDAFYEAGLSSWDVAAGMLLVACAKGRVTDYTGAAVDVMRPTRVLATNDVVHGAVQAVLAPHHGEPRAA